MKRLTPLIQMRTIIIIPQPAPIMRQHDNTKVRVLYMEMQCLRKGIETDPKNKEILEQFDRIRDEKICFKYPLDRQEVELENKLKECRQLLRKNNLNTECKCANEYKKKEEKVDNIELSIGLGITTIVLLGFGYLIYDTMNISNSKKTKKRD